MADEVEGEVVGEAGRVEELGEDEGQKDSEGADDGGLWEREFGRGRSAPVAVELRDLCFVPAADPGENDHAEEGGDGEPGGSALADGQDNESDEKGADGGAGVAADLEERLGETVLASGGEAGDAGGFRMEDGGADADEGGGSEEEGEGGGDGEEEESGEGEDHADGEGEGHRATVGIAADEGLQEGGEDLVGHGDEADLAEIEIEGALENRVHGREQRLHHVVEHVADADGAEDSEEGLLLLVGHRCFQDSDDG